MFPYTTNHKSSFVQQWSSKSDPCVEHLSGILRTAWRLHFGDARSCRDEGQGHAGETSKKCQISIYNYNAVIKYYCEVTVSRQFTHNKIR